MELVFALYRDRLGYQVKWSPEALATLEEIDDQGQYADRVIAIAEELENAMIDIEEEGNPMTDTASGRASGATKPATDGLIVADYECHCAVCDDCQLGLGRAKERAAKSLLRAGWSRLNGRWHCGKCSARAALRRASGGEGEGR